MRLHKTSCRKSSHSFGSDGLQTLHVLPESASILEVVRRAVQQVRERPERGTGRRRTASPYLISGLGPIFVAAPRHLQRPLHAGDRVGGTPGSPDLELV